MYFWDQEIETKLSYTPMGPVSQKEKKMFYIKVQNGIVHWWIQTCIVDLYSCLQGPHSAVKLELEVGNFWPVK